MKAHDLQWLHRYAHLNARQDRGETLSDADRTWLRRKELMGGLLGDAATESLLSEVIHACAEEAKRVDAVTPLEPRGVDISYTAADEYMAAAASGEATSVLYRLLKTRPQVSVKEALEHPSSDDPGLTDIAALVENACFTNDGGVVTLSAPDGLRVRTVPHGAIRRLSASQRFDLEALRNVKVRLCRHPSGPFIEIC